MFTSALLLSVVLYRQTTSGEVVRFRNIVLLLLDLRFYIVIFLCVFKVTKAMEAPHHIFI